MSEIRLAHINLEMSNIYAQGVLCSAGRWVHEHEVQGKGSRLEVEL